MSNKISYINEFNRRTYKRFSLLFNKEKDKKIIEAIIAHDNITDYIRQLIENDVRTQEAK